MSLAENKALAQRWFEEVWDQGRVPHPSRSCEGWDVGSQPANDRLPHISNPSPFEDSFPKRETPKNKPQIRVTFFVTTNDDCLITTSTTQNTTTTPQKHHVKTPIFCKNPNKTPQTNPTNQPHKKNIKAGAEVNGHISRIGSPGGKQLTLSILNADFTPPRPVEVAFDDIVLADGKPLPLHVTAVPGSGQVIRLVDSGSAKGAPAKSGLSTKMDEAKQEWRQTMSQVKQPGKMHRVMRLGIAQLPVHPQYIDAGTLYYADLQEPLKFGDESRKEETCPSRNWSRTSGRRLAPGTMTTTSSV
jgi:hypothetical protein